MAQEENNSFTGASSAAISLIGSIAAALMKLGAPYVVAWCKYFSPQRVVFVGGIIYGIASVLASFGKELCHFQLTQGLLIGIIPAFLLCHLWQYHQLGLESTAV